MRRANSSELVLIVADCEEGTLAPPEAAGDLDAEGEGPPASREVI
jgi:hypothetical protein